MDVSSKLTLYDLLAMLVPGWLLVVCFEHYFAYQLQRSIATYDLITVTSLKIILSYVIGLVWNSLMDFLFRFVRNDIGMIRHAFIEKNGMECGIKRFLYILKVSVLLLSKIFRCSKRSVIDGLYLRAYYESYYYVMKNTYTNAIPVLEGQVAMLRNVVLIVFIFDIFIFDSFSISCILFISSLLIYVVMIYRQYRIYELVREDYKYLYNLKRQGL